MSNLLKKTTSAVAGLAVAFSIVGPMTSGVSAAYNGVAAANKLAQHKVIVDQSNAPAAYRLGDTITRREQVKVAMNLAAACRGITVSDSCEGKSFGDVNSNDWGCKYVETALATGIVSPNKNFYPNRKISKAEALKMVMNSAGIVKGNNAVWEAAYVEGATSAKILDAGFTDYTTNATRGWIFQTAAASLDVCKGNVTNDVIDSTIKEEDKKEDKKETVVAGGTVKVTLSPENPQSIYVPEKTPRVKMLAFDVTAGDKDVRLNSATLFQVGPGNRKNVKDLAVYDSNNQKVSNTRSFGSEQLEINFNRDIVVKAGERASFYIAGMIEIPANEATNTMYQLRLANLATSATVTGGNITGPLMAPIAVTNAGELEFKNAVNLTDSKIEIGKEVVLAAYSLRELKDNEDVMVRSMTLEQVGKVSPEYIQDLALYADGKEVAKDLRVNGQDQLIINKDIVIPSGRTVRFELRGKVTGDVKETIGFELDSLDDIYATGVTTGYTVSFNPNSLSNNDRKVSQYNPSLPKIEGAEIDAVFTRVDKDQIKPDTRGFVIGTLKLTANSADYTIEKLTVKANGDVSPLVENVKLGSYAAKNDAPSNGEYVFEDIYLTKGKTIELPLEMDVKKAATIGSNLKFDLAINDIEDETNRRVSYTGNEVNNILSTNEFTTRNVTVQNANVTVEPIKLVNNSVVSGTGVEVVGYKAKMTAGDADSVLVRGATFKGTDLNSKVSRATLLVGSQSYNGNVTNDAINFNNVSYKLDAGATDVEMTLVLTLKSNIPASTVINLAMQSLLAYNSDNQEITVSPNQNNNFAKITIQSSGEATITVDGSSSNDDNLENTVLAGTDNVVLANLKAEARNEDMKVKDFTVTYTGDAGFANALSNVKLVAKKDGKVIATGATVSNGKIIFRNDFVLNDNDNKIDVELRADIAPIDKSGGSISFNGGDFQVTKVEYKATGMASAEDQTTNLENATLGEKVAVVMTKITPSVVATFSDGSAKVKFTADSGKNRDANGSTPEVAIKTITFVDKGNYTDATAYKLSKDGQAANEINGVKAGNKVTFTLEGSSVDNTFDSSNTYVIDAARTKDQTYGLVLSGDAIVYTVGGTDYTYNVTSDINLGTKTY